MTIVEQLRSWAQNEEMVDSSFTEHGKICNAAADEIERLESVIYDSYYLVGGEESPDPLSIEAPRIKAKREEK